MQLQSQQNIIKDKIKTIMTTSFNIIVDLCFSMLLFIYNGNSNIILTFWYANVYIYRPGLLLYPFLNALSFKMLVFNALLSKS